MTDSKADLIAKYLAGECNAEELEQLNRQLAGDPHGADALMSEAYMDIQLRETLSGSELGAALKTKRQPSLPVAGIFRPRYCMAAVVLLLAVSGWGAAAYFASELGDVRTNNAALVNRVTELESADTDGAVEVAHSEAPEIFSLRGWLMTSSENGTSANETHLLPVGITAPLNQKMWTCPWGATEFRYDSGVSISVERNTSVKFNETKGRRRLTLDSGIVHVTNLSKLDKRPTEVQCETATVRLIQGQVAVQVDEHSTAVEVAINHAQVIIEENGIDRTLTVRRGHYLIIRPDEPPKVKRGMLKLGLEVPGA